jgi:hypothetical protein
MYMESNCWISLRMSVHQIDLNFAVASQIDLFIRSLSDRFRIRLPVTRSYREDANRTLHEKRCACCYGRSMPLEVILHPMH